MERIYRWGRRNPVVSFLTAGVTLLVLLIAVLGPIWAFRESKLRIAAQTKANLLVDREALDDPDLIFRREGGGFQRLDRLFDGRLQSVLESFNEAVLRAAA